MGSYLSTIGSGVQIITEFALIGLKLSKIRQFHGAYKSTCDNYAISLTEFESIFSSTLATFLIFDTENNGKSWRYVIIL
jgi:hypothetical protein